MPQTRRCQQRRPTRHSRSSRANEIRSAEPGGKLDAGYFNPRPINVAKAEASQEGETVRVFIELRDVNYPGSTYTLAYDPATDQFKGIYYQALQRQQFEVYFERVK
jgi:hypothetical protein